jgi:F-type H+-transporting ATPase subunit delta
MSLNKIATRYAKSLLDLSIEQNVLTEVKGDMESFLRMITNKDLHLLLKSPIVNATKKEQIFKALFDGKFNKLTSAFMTLILKKGRESNLPDIAKDFIRQYKELIGLSSVKITSAVALDEATIADLKTKLIASKETAKDVEVITAVDPKLLGGFVIQIGDKLYDNSILHKLNQVKKNISNQDFVKSL